MRPLPRPGGLIRVVVPAALIIAATAAPAGALRAAASGPAAGSSPTRALIIVRTLVVDALGTRTVDTDSARVPFGGRGLLVKSVPYAGPPLSFRLAVLAGPPQAAGIPLTLSAEIWGGDLAAEPAPGGASRREEATVVSPESSYLIEIDHDEKADRRVLLSVSARPITEDDTFMPPALLDAARPVQLLLEVVREAEGEDPLPDSHLLNTIVGRSVTYSSGVKVRAQLASGQEASRQAGSQEEWQTVGLGVTLTVEQARGDLVTVRIDLEGAEFVDQTRERLEPVRHSSVHTVSSGSRIDVSVDVPAKAPPDGAAPAAQPADRPVRYRVSVIPTLG